MTAAGPEAIEAWESYLNNVGQAWHGVSLPQRFDQKIEGESSDYLHRSIPEAGMVEPAA